MDWLKYHINPQSSELPVDWKKIFKRDAKIRVEIGFGNGEFLAHMAKKFPDINFIGFELSITSFVKAQKKFHREGIDNVRLVMVDGRFGIRELFEDESVEHVYVNFPCPWSKKGQEKKRITYGDFAKALAAVLEMGGAFELMTDDKGYAEEVFSKFKESGFFDMEPMKVDFKRDVQTRYEKKWISMGRHTFLIRARKIKRADVERISWGGEYVHQRIDHFNEERLHLLNGKVFKDKRKVFVVKETYSSKDGNVHLIKVISSDDGFEQHYNILVEKRKNFWIVKLDSTCQPYRTPSVKWSVRKIAQEISLT